MSAWLMAGPGCVDLTLPWQLTVSTSDGSTTDGTGAPSGGGALGTGGVGASGGSTGAHGGGGTGMGEDAGRGTGGRAADAGTSAGSDARNASGGAVGPDAKGGTGGLVGAGGGSTPGTGGTEDARTTSLVPDSGTPRTGGIVGAGGTTGSGGVVGSGGGVGTGGSTGYGGYAPYDCANPIVPSGQGVTGLLTDFSDWNVASGSWGSLTGVYGTAYTYSGTNGTMNKAAVEGSPVGLHLTGSVGAVGYAGGGLTFLVVATLVPFTKVQFDIVGGAPGCSLEMQIQTYDKRPTTQVPAGGCDSSTGATCFGFPTVEQIVDVSKKITSVKTVTTSLSSFSNWSTANAKQVVGLQWQFTGTVVTGSNRCPVDVTIGNIRFLP